MSKAQTYSWWQGFQDYYEGSANVADLSPVPEDYQLGWNRAEQLLLAEHELAKEKYCEL